MSKNFLVLLITTILSNGLLYYFTLSSGMNIYQQFFSLISIMIIMNSFVFYGLKDSEKNKEKIENDIKLTSSQPSRTEIPRSSLSCPKG
jgi:hypothetical protein